MSHIVTKGTLCIGLMSMRIVIGFLLQETNLSECKDGQPNCEVLNSTLAVCNDVRNGVILCKYFCHLCEVVNGEWSDWATWADCDVTCGNGLTTRTRACDKPTPAHGGSDCVGPASSSNVCTLKNCPLHGGWSTWSLWGTCSTTCDVGIRRRDRRCDNPVPSEDGLHCKGESIEYKICHQPSCTELAIPDILFRVRTPSDQSLMANDDVLFKRVLINDGEAYNVESGRFTSPVDGTYSFILQYCVAPNRFAHVEIVKNGKSLQRGAIIAARWTQCANLHSMTWLQAGHHIWIRCTYPTLLYEDRYAWTTFSGALMYI
ncbi:coadhesin-like [Dreissena polymorpha]|nr:coadhesin-like [Dreissena polymorpha]